MRIFVVLILATTICYALDPTTKDPDGVSPPQIPENLPRIEVDHRVFRDIGRVAKVSKTKAKLTFATTHKCSPARVFVGGYNPMGPKVPVYVSEIQAKVVDADERGYGRRHELYFDLSSLSKKSPFPSKTVCYRLSVHVPEENADYCYEGRFSYDEHFEILSITSGPWVDCVDDTSAIISFDTDCESLGMVVIHDAKIIVGDEKATHHEIAVQGLEPETVYHYQVKAVVSESESDRVIVSPKFHFRTGSKKLQKFSFAAMTDSRGSFGGSLNDYNGSNLATLRKLFADLLRREVKLVFFPGDLINGYTTTVDDFRQQLHCWKQAVEPVGNFLPIYEGMGNHEACFDVYRDGSRYGLGFDKRGAESAEALFAEAFVNPVNGPEKEAEGLPPYRENVFYHDFQQVRFVMLNTNYWICSDPETYGGNLEGYILPRQMAWLQKILDQAEQSPDIRYVFVGTHEPVFPVGKHKKDAMWYNGGIADKNKGKDRSYILRRRDELWRMLTGCSKVVAVICGDEHNYSRLLITPKTPVYLSGKANPDFERPLHCFVSGGAGAPLYKVTPEGLPWQKAIQKAASVHHYLLFTVAPEKVEMQCITDTGAVVDRCVLR